MVELITKGQDCLTGKELYLNSDNQESVTMIDFLVNVLHTFRRKMHPIAGFNFSGAALVASGECR